ncbi:MAG: LacI family DNA-binding transcriptional regulator [Rikenellaceae bacterium]
MGTKTAVLKDIAEKAGVSISLVSFVLNGKAKQYRVADSKAEKILQIAKELNYKPNMVAKGLRSGRTKTLGLILADISSPFFARLARKIEDYSHSKGYAVIIASTDERADKQRLAIDTLTGRGVDGFIICASEESRGQISELANNAMPVVVVDRYHSELQVPTVRLDNFVATYGAAKHLINQGFKRIALVTFESKLKHINERIDGYTAAIEEHNLPVIVRTVLHKTASDDTTRVVNELLNQEDRPDAFFFTEGMMCMDGLRVIKSRELIVPTDVGIVSFDKMDSFDLFYTPITYIEQPINEYSICAVDIVINSIEEKNTELNTHDNVIIMPNFVINKSSLKISND